MATVLSDVMGGRRYFGCSKSVKCVITPGPCRQTHSLNVVIADISVAGLFLLLPAPELMISVMLAALIPVFPL
jgi:hypothetical protein